MTLRQAVSTDVLTAPEGNPKTAAKVRISPQLMRKHLLLIPSRFSKQRSGVSVHILQANYMICRKATCWTYAYQRRRKGCWRQNNRTMITKSEPSAFSFTLSPLFRTFNCLRVWEFESFGLLPFLGGGLFAQSWDCGSFITLIIVLPFLEEIPRAWLHFCPFLIFIEGYTMLFSRFLEE